MNTGNPTETPGDERCPECGGIPVEGRTCQQKFDELLALEFTDPDYGAVHFLTVSCYLVQHRRYSDQALGWIAGKLIDYLERGFSADQIRSQASRDADQHQRKWKASRGQSERQLPDVAWTIRIGDITYPPESPQEYSREITAWARATVEEMQPWLEDSLRPSH